ncbi:MAG: 4-(cytidine 5'-diphospho)-2-C-methyl-D-erythritol kinase [Geminicoccaceae bacterium]|nr:4-(cytidine 5'-diphospho)-2-C-methyl-D-erythritol kinase [Geminicoccaceae bacterium]
MTEGSVVETARAKINLDLLVRGRRDDGYHELDSLVVFAEPSDRLTLTSADRWSIEGTGPFASSLPDGGDNIVMRAATRLLEETGGGSPVCFDLEKNLPVASGIGGGSSDAAAALRGLCRLWALAMDDERLRDIGAALGADLPVCLYGRPARMRGIGERLDPVRGLPEIPLLLVNPGFGVSTGQVFRALDLDGDALQRPPLPMGASLVQFAIWLQSSRNDLEPAALTVEPRIAGVLDALCSLDDVIVSRMSGSGATCFAIFRTAASARAAETLLRREHPAWWVHATSAGTPAPSVPGVDAA